MTFILDFWGPILSINTFRRVFDYKATDLNIAINNAQILRFYDKPFMVPTDRFSANRLQNF
jgi:hypothetical protein